MKTAKYEATNILPTFQRGATKAITPADNAYERALAKIEQLQIELEQMRLRESLKACIQTIQKTQNQLNHLGTDVKQDYRQYHDHIEALEQEIWALESSNAAWSNRSITLEFKLLSAQDEIKTIKAKQDLAASIIAFQEMELKALKMEKQPEK